ncbi:MAG: hypothetical protein KBS96_05445 [Lachnospiraceae bacterium]|nr:hypothetical protein [Candidatus Colinaster scatohippi]
MLDNVSVMFEDKGFYLKKMRRPLYEKNMEVFGTNYKKYFDEIIDTVAAAEDKRQMAIMLGDCFAYKMREAYVNKKKIPPQLAMDLNLMMIYYVFPGILLTKDVNAELIADAFKEKWNEIMECSIDYADYQTIRDGFSNKLFGLF